MKKSNAILLTATATVTMVALIACGSKSDNTVNAQNIAKPGGGVNQKAVKDQSGSIGLNGAGALSGATSSANPFGDANLNPYLDVQDTAVLASPNVSDLDKKAIVDAQAKTTFINMGCELSKNTIDTTLKGLTPDDIKPQADVNSYSAAIILICADKAVVAGKILKVSEYFKTSTTLTAGKIYFHDATIPASAKNLKLIVRAESIYLSGNGASTIYAPAKSEMGTGMDLIVSKEILGAVDANGKPTDTNKLKLMTAAQIPVTGKNPGRGSKNISSTKDLVGATNPVDANDFSLSNNNKVNLTNTIEEDNGNTEGN